MEQPVIGLGVWEVIVSIGNLLVLYFILKRILFGPVTKMIKQREDQVKSIYNDADQAKTEALALKNEYEQNIKGAKDKALEIINDATTNATRRANNIVDEAQQEARNVKEKALNSIELEKKQAFNELHKEIADIATMTASKILEKEINKDDHKKLIDDFISKVGE